tara:strand:+ start:69 stop:440 length:372 start_codon:yes stop_codon:yes gene_type:complete
MMTYQVHMRSPEIIISATWMTQICWFLCHILASLSHFILATALWSFWVIPFGLPHPVLLLLWPNGASTIVGFFFIHSRGGYCAQPIRSKQDATSRSRPLYADPLALFIPRNICRLQSKVKNDF